MARKPLVLANWKMAMRIEAGRTFVRELESLAADCLDRVDVVLCPPYTALWAVSQARHDPRIQFGGQNTAPDNEAARTGEVSAELLADAGCEWVMLGHWEVRRHLGDDPGVLRRKVQVVLESGLRPMVFLGEAHGDTAPLRDTLDAEVGAILDGCPATQVARMALLYEPEGTIGAAAPATPEHAAQGCAILRDCLRRRWGAELSETVRIIYGGSVAPEWAPALLSSPDVDGLGVGRRGRKAEDLAIIVRLLAQRATR